MTVSKAITGTPADGKSYQLGEMITYTITVLNDGNVTITGVTVSDEKTGDENLSVTPSSLAPGDTGVATVKYTVTEDDILAGGVLNEATANGTAPKGVDVPTVEDGKVETKDIADPAPELNVDVTSDKDGQKVVEGDKIEYTITVTNDGNVTINGIELADSLGVLPEDLKDIGDLKPGESKTITYTYTVQPEDMADGEVKNTITAEGTDPEGKNVKGSGDNTVTTDEIQPAMTVKGKSDQEGKEPVPGTWITYTVTITNDGNATLYDLILNDPLVVLPADKRNIESLAPGESITITYEYLVTQDDAKYGVVVFKPTVTGQDPSGAKISNSDKTSQPIGNNAPAPTYPVTVNYWYEEVGGKMAAPQFLNYYKEGDQYTVISRQLPGYTVDVKAITGTMEAKELVFDVIYTPETHTVTIRLVDEKGNPIGEDLIYEFTVGEHYSIELPAINGYAPIIGTYTGIMKGKNETLTAFYMPVDAADGNGNNGSMHISIDDYRTPLTGANASYSSGECVE